MLRPARQGHVRTGGEADISGPQGKSEDQPPAKQIAPAEAVTPPAEVHACPTVYSAPCTIRLPLPAYRGDRLAFAPHTAGLWPDCSMSACPMGPVSQSRTP